MLEKLWIIAIIIIIIIYIISINLILLSLSKLFNKNKDILLFYEKNWVLFTYLFRISSFLTVNVNCDQYPSSDATLICPPRLSTIFFEIESPIPLP